MSVCGLPVLAGFVIPVLVLGRLAFLYFDESWTPAFKTYALNSLMLSFVAALLH